MTTLQFQQRYSAAFATFLAERDEQSLRAAYELGRDAVRYDISLLEIAQAHHDALERRLADASADEVMATCSAAGEFLVESLAAFEMVQRGSSEARRAALIERRNARMLRQLSTLLADESLAAGDRESFAEVLQLVAEHAREMTGARRGSVYVRGTVSVHELRASSESDGEDTWSDVMQPQPSARQPSGRQQASVCVDLLALDGSDLGWIEVEGKPGGAFSEGDAALLTQVAQLTGAAVERALAYT